MNSKTLLAALVGGIVCFLLGFLVFGILLDSFFKAHTVMYDGLMKDPKSFGAPSMIAIFVANLAMSLLVALICSWSNMVGLMKGAVIGGTVGFITQLNYDLFNVALMNLYTDSTIVVVDVVLGAIFWSVIGGIIGWMMARGRKAEIAV